MHVCSATNPPLCLPRAMSPSPFFPCCVRSIDFHQFFLLRPRAMLPGLVYALSVQYRPSTAILTKECTCKSQTVNRGAQPAAGRQQQRHKNRLQALNSHSEGTKQSNAEGQTSVSYTGWQVSSEMVSCCSTLPPCGASAPRICMLSWRRCQSNSSMPKEGSLTKPQSPSIRRPAHSLRGGGAGGDRVGGIGCHQAG